MEHVASRTTLEPPGFDEFWAAYPRRDDKQKARAAFTNAARSAAVADIVAGAVRYRDDRNRDPLYTKMPATWLNAGAWANQPLPPRGGARPSGRYEPRVIGGRSGRMAVEE